MESEQLVRAHQQASSRRLMAPASRALHSSLLNPNCSSPWEFQKSSHTFLQPLIDDGVPFSLAAASVSTLRVITHGKTVYNDPRWFIASSL